MTTTAGSVRKPNVFNEANESLYEPFPEYFTSPKVLMEMPWPEWNDAELNAEVWNEPKSRASAVSKTTAISQVPDTSYEDAEFFKFPLTVSSEIYSWKRPQDVFPDATLTLFDPSNVEFELTILSKLVNWNVFKSFNETLPILQFYALQKVFPVELETSTFVSTTQGEPWKPWHHIYAYCKAGKGQTHKPLFNVNGKYIVRLFHMGCWRKHTIDDKIPCDKFGRCMLPVTQVRGELWPIILSKALLNITSLTPSKDLAVMDLPFLSFFTGWIRGDITSLNKTSEQIWRRIYVLNPNYELPKEEAEIPTAATTAKDQSKRGSSKKEALKDTDKKNDSNEENFCLLLVTLSGLENLKGDHTVAVTMTRNYPLVKANKREATKLWKRIRWIYWASKKGLWTDELKQPPYRRLLCVTFVKNLFPLIVPDPQQEAAIFDVPQIEDSASNEEATETISLEPEQWCDYFKLYGYCQCLNIYLKPSIFNSHFKVTNILKEALKSVEVPVSTKSTAKIPSPPQSTIFFQTPVLKPCCNEPPYLFCESATEQFLCISLSVCSLHHKNSIGYLDPNHPEVLKIGQACLIIENLNWRTVEQGEIIGVIITVGNSSIGLNIKQGRHILRLWLISESPYVLDVYSSTEINVYKGPKIRFLMTAEAERILNYINVVSNAFINLTAKFGKSDLPAALREFYETIKPGNKSMIGYYSKLDNFIETFLNCILLALQSLIFNTDELKVIMGALQSLFFNPNIQCDLPPGKISSKIFGGGKKTAKKPPPVVKERTLSQILAYPWSEKEIQNVIFIQKIFRGFRVRLLWKKQTPSRKEFKVYTDRLKKICDTVFSPSKRDVEVAKIIRKVVSISPDLFTTFKFYEDFPNVIEVEEFSGKIANVEPFAWIPIARFIVACHSVEPLPCSFYFSSNLEQFIIQGIDNDINEELFRLTNSVSPHYYQNNVKGYTIFVFGWNEANQKTVNWRLEMVRMKYFEGVHLCNTLLGSSCHPYVVPNLEVSEVKNFYIPNSKFRICRCLIKIHKRSLLTLRLCTSYSEVKFIVYISLDKKFCSFDAETSEVVDKVIFKGESSSGALLLPAVLLEFLEPNSWWGEVCLDEPTTYILEAFVVNKSWPLTNQEWGVVEPFRVNGENWKDSSTNILSRKSGSESRKKISRTSKRSFEKLLENPFWLLQVLNDPADLGDSVIVEEDKSYIEDIRNMKISWEEKDPGRRKRGRNLRLNFLSEIYNENSERDGVLGEVDSDKEENSEEGFKLLLRQMSSFSYLTNDTSIERFSKSPRVLPPMPTLLLFRKYQKIEEVSEEEEEQNALETTGLQRDLSDEIEEAMRGFLNLCVYYRSVMVEHQEDEQKISIQLMDQAYKMRSKAVERMMVRLGVIGIATLIIQLGIIHQMEEQKLMNQAYKMRSKAVERMMSS